MTRRRGSPLTAEVYESLSALIEYASPDERKHWEEAGRPRDHIFLDLERIAAWLDEERAYLKDYDEAAP